MGLDWFQYYTARTDVASRKRYDAPADLWKLVRVNPADVEYLSVIVVKWGLGRVRGGEWDDRRNLTPVEDIPAAVGFRQRFEGGADWTETAYFEMAKTRIDEHGQFRGCEDVEEFLETKCREIDELYESIKEVGYRPNCGTVYESPVDAEYIHDLELMVLIGRVGEIYWTEGFHRLVLAKLLDVETIPVYVLQRHEEWQQVREEIHGTPTDELPPALESYADHPDVQDLVL